METTGRRASFHLTCLLVAGLGMSGLGMAACSDDTQPTHSDTGPDAKPTPDSGRDGSGRDLSAQDAADDARNDAQDDALPGPDALADAAPPYEPCPDDNSQWTVGRLLDTEDAFVGYTLFAPMGSKDTYLIDNCGQVVHQWEGQARPAASVYLEENGHLLRTEHVANAFFVAGGAGGRVVELDWDGTVVWEYVYSTPGFCAHHDVQRLPNGNVLLVAWERKTTEQAIAAGRDPDLLGDQELWVDHLIEVQPNGTSDGTIVWEWHLWDHLIQDLDPTKLNYGVVADHPELVDLNYTRRNKADWTHFNAVAYNPTLDQIVVSPLTFAEFWVIDHSTTTAQAAGHSGGNSGRGGDILYRWGNPVTYRAGTDDDRFFYGLHDPHWIDSGLDGAGHILVFHNGNMRPDGTYSSVEELVLPLNAAGTYDLTPGQSYGPSAPFWSYAAPAAEDFHSRNISGAQRLPNGNTLICSGANGTLFEVTSAGDVVWTYVNPVTSAGILRQGQAIPQGPGGGLGNPVFRAQRYAPDYPGLAGRALIPDGYVELPEQ